MVADVKKTAGAQVVAFPSERVQRVVHQAHTGAEQLGRVAESSLVSMVDTAQGFMRQFDRLANAVHAIYRGPEQPLNPRDEGLLQGYVTAAQLGNARAVAELAANLRHRDVMQAVENDVALSLQVYVQYVEQMEARVLYPGRVTDQIATALHAYLNTGGDACTETVISGAAILAAVDSAAWQSVVQVTQESCQLF